MVRVLHEPMAGVPWYPRQEAYDSTFFDLTVFQAGDTTITDVIYIGILNRRTDGLRSTEEDGLFMTYEEFHDFVNNPTTGEPDSLYTQHGSRRIRMPFNYDGPSATAVNLHVEELRAVDATQINQRAPIDTIVGAHTNLDVDLLPGEGKFFRVTPVPATSQSGEGFLDNSNQRKIVAYPKADDFDIVTDPEDERTYVRQINGDTMWYHRVYHRRRHDAAPVTPNNLSVYYQRSQPLLTAGAPSGTAADAFHASTVEWEQEILLSDAVIHAGDTLDMSCGYPAVVVRPDIMDLEVAVKVYAVFACEFDIEDQPAEILICEAVLPAEGSRMAQVDYLQDEPAESIALTLGDVNDQPVLKHWGTPMVNASAWGNYYCWSHKEDGIHAGYKVPGARQFNQNHLLTIPSDTARYPSLNSYSRLHIGEADCGIVWSGNDRKAILYSRLGIDGNGDLAYYLNPGGPASRVVVGAAGLVAGWDPQIALISFPLACFEDTCVWTTMDYPVLTWQLSDWEMEEPSEIHDLRIVNHKAGRIYWQEELLWPSGGSQVVVGRRNVDVRDWTKVSAGPDTVWSQYRHYIMSDAADLKGPDVAQGTQWGQPFSTPEDASSWHEDSSSVVEFWSETSPTDPAPSLWTMTFGWDFYGEDDDHTVTDLVSEGILHMLDDQGKYPHLAARYTTMAFPGWQRNRRIFNAPTGIWENFADAPPMHASSQYFFKGERARPHGLVYAGLRSANGDALMGPLWVHSKGGLLGFKPVDDRTNQAQDSLTLATPWFTLETVDDLGILTRGYRDEKTVAEAWIERRSDGLRMTLNAFARNQDNAITKDRYTVLADPTDQYRLVLRGSADQAGVVHDIEITFDDPTSFGREGSVRMILDLRTMNEVAAGENELVIQPNPAMEHTRIVVAIHGKTRPARLRITSLDGAVVIDRMCMSLDVVSISTDHFPAGVYIVNVTARDGSQLTSKLLVQ